MGAFTMNVADVIQRATQACIEMAVGDDGRLQLRADQAPSAELLAELVEHKAEILATLSATKDSHLSHAWIHLLALDDGRVIQTCGVVDTATAERRAHQQYGNAVLTVLAVPGFDRPLSDEQIVKALAGTLEPPPAPPGPSPLWLPRIARLLGVTPAYLLEGGCLDAHDLVELAHIDPEVVAAGIRRNPAWISPTYTYPKRNY